MNQKQSVLQEVQKINQADVLYKNNSIVDAASLLYSIDLTIIPEESKVTYDTLANKIFSEAGLYHYNSGQKNYSQGDYNNAKINFEKSLLYVKDKYYSDNALYYLGRIYEDEKDIEKAKEVYQQAINQYNGTDGANNSKWRLNNLQ